MPDKIPTQPYKGARDFYPLDMRLRNYIFDTWKKVCKRYGFQEYSFPVLEPLEIFSAKSGEELVRDQIFSFEDRGKRKIAVRPELTPGTVRMIADKFNEIPKPIKWFMIGDNWRYEKPQLGRGREFYQLEANMFGVKEVTADFEIFQLIISILTEFGAKEGQFEVLINDRRLILALLNQELRLDPSTSDKVRKIMDKWLKIGEGEFSEIMKEYGLSQIQAQKVIGFLKSDFEGLGNIINQDTLDKNEGYSSVKLLFSYLESSGLDKYCRFSPAVIRGFDYSDGLVYEVFDMNPSNNRSIFGGERFDKLISIFGNYELEATGFAMGDLTFVEFLKNWGLVPQLSNEIDYLVTVWPGDNSEYLNRSLICSDSLRKKGKNVYLWPDTTTKIDKQLKYADRAGIPSVIILGDAEIKANTATVKSLKTGQQESVPLNHL